MNRAKWSIVLLSSIAFFSCKQKPPAPAVAVPVNVQTVRAQHVTYYDKFPSTVQALSQVDIRPEVQGYITAIKFKDGNHVKRGQELYEIDKSLYQQSLDAALANLKVAQGNQLQAKQDADRYTYLNKKDAVAEQLYDHAVIALENANNSVAAAQQSVNSAKTNLSYAVINAPFSGTIGFSQVRLGNMVTVGSTILDTISTDDPMAVDFLINESQLGHYEELQKNPPKDLDSLFTIVLPDNSLYPYTGKIYFIDRAIDPQTGTMRVRLSFPNPKQTLRTGMSCVVRVHNQDVAPQMLIPGKAVVEQMGEYFVFVVKDTIMHNPADSTKKEKARELASDTVPGPRYHAFQKKVQLGQTIGPNVIIKEGINVGDDIVVDGVQALHDGSRVAVPTKQVAQNAAADDSLANQAGLPDKIHPDKSKKKRRNNN